MANAGIGFVLSGGGTRGLVHIGAWQELAALGFQPSAIAGCSMGALIGAAIAAGRSGSELEVFAEKQKLRSFVELPVSPLGLSNLRKLQRTFLSFIKSTTFEELATPLVVNATNLTTGQTVVFNRGPLWPAIRASLAVPGIFAPVRTDDGLLVDGAVLNQHPFTLLPASINRFILVDASPMDTLPTARPTIVDLLRASVRLAGQALLQERLRDRQPDSYVTITPNLAGRSLLERERDFPTIIALGRRAVQNQRPAILRLINQKTSSS